MEKIRLNGDFKEFRLVPRHGYELEPQKEYVISLADELKTQYAIMAAMTVFGDNGLLSDYHEWLKDNGFSQENPNPTNEFVASYYGKKPLWKSNRSQGIVVKNETDNDFYIVMECSYENEGFKYTKIIVTLGGCL